MTRKDYQAIAKEINSIRRDIKDYPEADNMTVVQNRIANMLKQDNPAFNRELFIKACNE